MIGAEPCTLVEDGVRQSLQNFYVEQEVQVDAPANFSLIAKLIPAVAVIPEYSIMPGYQPMTLWQALKLAMKCADLNHAAKSWELHNQWSLRITEEMYLQVI